MQGQLSHLCWAVGLVLFVTCVRPVSSLALQRNSAQPLVSAPPLESGGTRSVRHVEANVTQVWNSPNGDISEDSADQDAWRAPESAHFVSQSTLPPRCPRDVPENAPYWSEKHWRDRTHTVCEYVDDCNSMVSNRERHDSIRNALAVTKQTLDGASVPYVLYGGSAIGQYRCEDVLPWDADCDVLIKKADISKLKAGPLSNGFVLREKSTTIPFVVVDTSTGFYCDIFQMDFEESRGTVAVAWPWGAAPCPQFPDRSLGEPMRCERYPLEAVSPYVPCVLNGVTHKCAHDQATYLATKYGDSWNNPNVSTRAL